MKIDFKKYGDGLVPAIVQDANSNIVLMLGFMNEEALQKTKETGLVTFFSRSKNRLWTKGETSGNFLKLKQLIADCDNDTILVKAVPSGPVCHTGADSCFNEKNEAAFLFELEQIIAQRKSDLPDGSYTASLFNDGLARIAQKVGEEAVEVVIEAMRTEGDRFENEAADLLFHLMILLQAKGYRLEDIVSVLKERHKKR